MNSRAHAFRALLDCCRLWLGSPPAGAFGDQRLDWRAFRDLAFVHNLEPLLHHLRSEDLLPGGDVPPALGERWEKAYFENFVFNCRALELTSELAARCAASDARVAAVKGAALVGHAWKDPALRIMADVDLLCDESDLPAIMPIARDLGFAEAQENAVYHASLCHREIGLLLELHFDLYDFLPDHRRLHGETLQAARPLRAGEVTIPALPIDSERALEVAHLVNHDLRVNLKPYLDLATGLRDSHPGEDFPEILETWDLHREFDLIVLTIDRLFGTSYYPTIRYSPDPTPAESLATTADAALAAIAEIESWGPPKALDELASRQGLVARLAYLRRLLLPPRERISKLSESAGVAQATRRGGTGSHMASVIGRGWSKLRRVGLVRSGDALSVKRSVYARRRR